MIQIVPRLGSESDGVADYARALAAALRGQEGIDTRFLRGDPADRVADASSAGASAVLDERSPSKLVSALEAHGGKEGDAMGVPVLLHYANYGYAPRGCPSWLVAGLEQWKRRNSRPRLVVMFHELYASGPPWRSSFWLSPVQRYLASRLARLCDVAITSSELYRRRLADWVPAKGGQVVVRPVFSTIGEPARAEDWSSRRAVLAVLGRAGTEERAYRRHRTALETALRSLTVEEIIDIGPRTESVPREMAGIRVRSTGHLPREEVSRLLSGCRAGFLDYPSDVLGKSTVFAAYCAHGVVPVITRVRGAELDGLREGVNFLLAGAALSGAPMQDEVLEEMSTSVLAWYGAHGIAVQASGLARMLT